MVVWLCNDAVMKLRLIEQACGYYTVRCGGGLKLGALECVCVPLALGWKCIPPRPCAPLQDLQVVCLCNDAVMKLRLIEQACGC